jgi:hypothetical protein
MMNVRLGLLVLTGLVLGLSATVEAQRTKSIPVTVAFRCAIDADCDDHVRGDGSAYTASISGTRIVMVLPDDGSRRLHGDFRNCALEYGPCDYSPSAHPLTTRRGRLVAFAVDARGQEMDLKTLQPGQSADAMVLVDFTTQPRPSTWEMWSLRFNPVQRIGSTWGTIRATSTGWVVQAIPGGVAAIEYNNFRTSSPEDRGRASITFEATIAK